jgi:hypothetical protein
MIRRGSSAKRASAADADATVVTDHDPAMAVMTADRPAPHRPIVRTAPIAAIIAAAIALVAACTLVAPVAAPLPR